jgi:hypothetical protein
MNYHELSGRAALIRSASLPETKEGVQKLIDRIDAWLESYSSLNSHAERWPLYQKEGLKFLAEELQAKKTDIHSKKEEEV